jgi:hypothetical protein
LTQSAMQIFLSSALGIATTYIVPKQGNWFNIQDQTGATTWVAFLVRDDKNRTKPFWQTVGGVQTSTSYVNSRVELQIVGDAAETLVTNVRHWPNRADVLSSLDAIQAQLYADGCGDCVVSPFVQDGLNTVLAYNVTFSIQWASTVTTAQTKVTIGNIQPGTITGG